jgi:glycosyltransferase involved in cell wall biosynthesis
MIVKNEEQNLRNCLDSVRDFVDEINIVDTGSTDSTVEIAREYTDRVFFFEWVDDFSAARNFSFSKATKEYIMWLDADDIIDEKNLKKLIKLKSKYKGNDGCITLSYIIAMDDEGKPSLTALRERIVKNHSGYKWQRTVHEQLIGPGPVTNWDAAVTHTKKQDDSFIGRNLGILEKTVNSPNCTPLDNYYYGILLNGLKRYKEAVEQLNLFIKNNKDESFTGIDAFVAVYNAYIALGDYENAYKVLAENERVNRDKSEYYCLLGYFIMNFLKDYKLAVTYFEKALKCTGKEADLKVSLQRYERYYYFEPLNYLGQCYTKLGLFEKARDAYVESMQYSEDNTETEKLLAILNKIIELGKLQN